MADHNSDIRVQDHDDINFDLQTLKDLWNKTYLITKSFLVLGVSFYILNLILPFLFDARYFYNTLENTLYNFQIYRLITYCLAHTRLFEILLVLYLYQTEGNLFEKQMGSVIAYLDLLIKGFMIQSTFLILVLLLDSAFQSTEMLEEYDGEVRTVFYYREIVYSSSLLPYSLYLLTSRCVQEPEKTIMFLCCPFQIKKRYYPLILFIFISFWGFRYDFFIAGIYGLLDQFIPDIYRFGFFKKLIKKAENSSIFEASTQFFLLQKYQEPTLENNEINSDVEFQRIDKTNNVGNMSEEITKSNSNSSGENEKNDNLGDNIEINDNEINL